MSNLSAQGFTPKQPKFVAQRSDTFDETYYYYGGEVDGEWQIHRYNHVDTANVDWLMPEIASLANNPTVHGLPAAFTARATLVYA
jgi:hypothetical protein